jgi:thiaminase
MKRAPVKKRRSFCIGCRAVDHLSRPITSSSVERSTIATWINAQPFVVRDGNPCAGWIAMYASDEFQAAAAGERDWLNERLVSVSPARFDELATISGDATRLEIDFWQMGLDRRF